MAAARKQPTYAEASAELEAILERIEGGEVDVDEVVTLVRRGAELIRSCRERLDAARLEVGKVVADLDALEKDVASQAAATDDGSDASGNEDEGEVAGGAAEGRLPF